MNTTTQVYKYKKYVNRNQIVEEVSSSLKITIVASKLKEIQTKIDKINVNN